VRPRQCNFQTIARPPPVLHSLHRGPSADAESCCAHARSASPVLRSPRRISFITRQWQAATFEQNDRVKTVGDGNQRHHTDLLEGYFYRAAHERLGRYGSGSSSGPLTTLETRIVLAESVRATLIRRRTALRRVHIQAGVIFTGTISASRHWGWIARLAPAPRRRVLGAAGRPTADGTQFGSI
jgi:hypothetical protein